MKMREMYTDGFIWRTGAPYSTIWQIASLKERQVINPLATPSEQSLIAVAKLMAVAIQLRCGCCHTGSGCCDKTESCCNTNCSRCSKCSLLLRLSNTSCETAAKLRICCQRQSTRRTQAKILLVFQQLLLVSQMPVLFLVFHVARKTTIGITQESVNTYSHCGSTDRPVGTLRVVAARSLSSSVVLLRPIKVSETAQPFTRNTVFSVEGERQISTSLSRLLL